VVPVSKIGSGSLQKSRDDNYFFSKSRTIFLQDDGHRGTFKFCHPER